CTSNTPDHPASPSLPLPADNRGIFRYDVIRAIDSRWGGGVGKASVAQFSRFAPPSRLRLHCYGARNAADSRHRGGGSSLSRASFPPANFQPCSGCCESSTGSGTEVVQWKLATHVPAVEAIHSHAPVWRFQCSRSGSSSWMPASHVPMVT